MFLEENEEVVGAGEAPEVEVPADLPAEEVVE